MRFSRQEYWSGLPCPPPGDLPNPGIKPTSLTSPALAGGFFTTAAAAKSLQSCLTLCDPIDGSPPGSSVHGIFQERVLEWGAIAFSIFNAPICGRAQLLNGYIINMGFPGDSEGKESFCNAGDLGLIPGSGRSPGNSNPVQYSCLENPMDRGAW